MPKAFERAKELRTKELLPDYELASLPAVIWWSFNFVQLFNIIWANNFHYLVAFRNFSSRLEFRDFICVLNVHRHVENITEGLSSLLLLSSSNDVCTENHRWTLTSSRHWKLFFFSTPTSNEFYRILHFLKNFCSKKFFYWLPFAGSFSLFTRRFIYENIFNNIFQESFSIDKLSLRGRGGGKNVEGKNERQSRCSKTVNDLPARLPL